MAVIQLISEIRIHATFLHFVHSFEKPLRMVHPFISNTSRKGHVSSQFTYRLQPQKHLNATEDPTSEKTGTGETCSVTVLL